LSKGQGEYAIGNDRLKAPQGAGSRIVGVGPKLFKDLVEQKG